MKKIIFTFAALAASYCSNAQSIFPTDGGNVGIGTTSPSTALQIGVFGDAPPSHQLFIPGIYNFEQVRLGQIGNGNSALEMVNHNATSTAYGFKFLVNTDIVPGLQLQYAPPSTTYSGLNYTTGLFMNLAGNIGIGTTSPATKLDVRGGNGSVYNTGGSTSFSIGSSTTGKTYIVLSTSADQSGYGILQSISAQGSLWGNTAINPTGGNVLIGKTAQTNAGYKLDVAGSLRANAIVVNTTGADFVFHPAYRLYPLSRLKKYIDQHQHLPEIASAREMQANGLNVGDNQVKLLQKVEELTLYLIEKDQQVNELHQQASRQEQQLADQQKINRSLQAQIHKLIKQEHR